MKNTVRHRSPPKRKKRVGLTVRSIVYKSSKYPHGRVQELKVTVPRGEIIDASYAAAMVAVRTGMPLAEVNIIKIAGVDE
ncbi:MAG: hypothetical protein ACRDS9_15410 [Pseudonocardiaceae bacterium]